MCLPPDAASSTGRAHNGAARRSGSGNCDLAADWRARAKHHNSGDVRMLPLFVTIHAQSRELRTKRGRP